MEVFSVRLSYSPEALIPQARVLYATSYIPIYQVGLGLQVPNTNPRFLL